MKYALITIALIILSSTSHAAVFLCVDESGRKSFTDDKESCKSSTKYELKDIVTYDDNPPHIGKKFPMDFGHQHCVGKTAYLKGEYEIKRDRIVFDFEKVEIMKTFCGKGPVSMVHIRPVLRSKKTRSGKKYSDETVKGSMVKVNGTLNKGESIVMDDISMSIFTSNLKSKNLNNYTLFFQLEGTIEGRVGWNYERYPEDIVPELN